MDSRAGKLMSTLKEFFKESDTQLGVFYPKHYLVAVFRNFRTAQQATGEVAAGRIRRG